MDNIKNNISKRIKELNIIISEAKKEKKWINSLFLNEPKTNKSIDIIIEILKEVGEMQTLVLYKEFINRGGKMTHGSFSVMMSRYNINPNINIFKGKIYGTYKTNTND